MWHVKINITKEEITMIFDAEKKAEECIAWINHWFTNQSGGSKGLVIGISGGKDSTVVAALCAKAIGKEKVLGILMPNGIQSDIADARQVIKETGICAQVVNIDEAYKGIVGGIRETIAVPLNREAMINIAPRVRMTVLYAVAQAHNYRVCGTSNLSERYIGYSTKWGDSACDFNPLGSLTSDEVVAVGQVLGLSQELTHKTPSDGLCGKSDEDNFGFTYAVLNNYIRTGTCENEDIKEKIDRMHLLAGHKTQMPAFLGE